MKHFIKFRNGVIEEYYLSRKVLLTLNAIREQYGLNPIDMGDAAIIEKSLLHAR